MVGDIVCPSCKAQTMRVFHSEPDVPVNSCLLLSSASDAKDFPRGAIRLGHCTACGFISNTAFDVSNVTYAAAYEETQGFSPRFRTFADQLARRLIDAYDLHGKTILEIGCGKGEFLTLLCEIGENRGIGIDPSYIDQRNTSPARDRMTFITDLYSDAYAEQTAAADFIVCRHTLEHIHPVADFVRTVRRSIGDRGTPVFFEVPDAGRVLREFAFWDIYYEHCSYFTPGSLARLFRAEGFGLRSLGLDFDDQYVLLEADPGGTDPAGPLPGEDDLEAIARDVETFERDYAAKVARWKEELERATANGRRAVVWGSGSKGVAYLTTLGVRDEIPFTVDINPYKQGMYMAGTGQLIVAPEFLKEHRPDVVIVMNPIYLDEIRRDLEAMDIDAELVAV
jgi:SAM-dependent methyltransferase